MRSLKTMPIALSLSSIFALGACANNALEDASRYVDEACACKDIECVETVRKKHKKTNNAEASKQLAKENPAEFYKLGVRLSDCMLKHELPDRQATESKATYALPWQASARSKASSSTT